MSLSPQKCGSTDVSAAMYHRAELSFESAGVKWFRSAAFKKAFQRKDKILVNTKKNMGF